METKIKRENYSVKLSEPILHVDNESRGRSGHMSHALAEWAPGKLIDFNSNCSAVIHQGHSTFGWIEYQISEDGGKTFSGPYDFPISKKEFIDGKHTVAVEKAVACNNGRIIAFCLFNDAHQLCEPWITPPAIVTSDDGGKNWSDKKSVFQHCGRIYDAVYYKEVVYVIQFCNDATISFLGNKKEHVYRLYKSENNGESFDEIAVIPTDSEGRSYASILFDENEKLHLYIYNVNDEHHPDHLVSNDFGKSWVNAGVCHLAKGSRNIQTALIDGIFVLHCRGEEVNRNKLALYTSENGYDWDEGTFVDSTEHNTCFYSNNIVLKDKDGTSRMLLQYSHSYFDKCVNIKHMWLEIEK